MKTLQHLVILKKAYLNHILQGCKTIEYRLSRNRRPPFGVVRCGDRLWLKQSGGLVRGTARVAEVEFVNPLAPADLRKLQKRYESVAMPHDAFFARHRSARYATIIKLAGVQAVHPFPFVQRSRHAWLVLPTSPSRKTSHRRFKN